MRALALTLVLATPAWAQEVIVTSPCQPGATPVTAADMGPYLAGTWQMMVPGTGFTTGTNVGSVTLRFDDASGTLFMEGQGVSVPLIPMNLARDVSDPEPPQPDFDASLEAMTPSGLTADEIALVADCKNPVRYWWEMSVGGNRSWGAMTFIFEDAASGFMANSAGGSRQMQLTR
ncbi:MAG: hypothetical protein AAFR50_09515 [Pseudomonadota bacterium]